MIIPHIALLVVSLCHHSEAKKSFYPLPFPGDKDGPKDRPDPAFPSRVVGGVEVNPPGKYSFMVSLQDSTGFHFCGGSLIDSRWVLSAAHCSDRGTHVEIGRHNLNDDTEFGVERIEIDYETVHPDFDYFYLQNDVMLVRLKEDSAYTPAQLNSNNARPVEDADLTVMGWGTTSFQGSSSDVLLEAVLDAVSNSDCNDAYGEGAVTADMMCAARAGKDACQGDSGGPLVEKSSGKQVGIVSWGKKKS